MSPNHEETAMLPIQTILHPTDFSSHSRCAFQLACSLAKDHGARLIVLHVVAPPVAYGEGMVSMEPEDWERLQVMLHELRPPDPQVRVEHRLADGDPARQILGTAQESKCDLIVMGTHGRTGLTRLLMGSVAEQVVRKAGCPVLTIKTPLEGTLTGLTVKQDTVNA